MHDLINRFLRRRPQQDSRHRRFRFSWKALKDKCDSPVDTTPPMSSSSSSESSQPITITTPPKPSRLRPKRWLSQAPKQFETLQAPFFEKDHQLLSQCIQTALSPLTYHDTRPKRWSMDMVDAHYSWLDYRLGAQQRDDKFAGQQDHPQLQQQNLHSHYQTIQRSKRRPVSANHFILLTSIPEVDSQITLDM